MREFSLTISLRDNRDGEYRDDFEDSKRRLNKIFKAILDLLLVVSTCYRIKRFVSRCLVAKTWSNGGNYDKDVDIPKK